jgi:hypothetical protein
MGLQQNDTLCVQKVLLPQLFTVCFPLLFRTEFQSRFFQVERCLNSITFIFRRKKKVSPQRVDDVSSRLVIVSQDRGQVVGRVLAKALPWAWHKWKLRKVITGESRNTGQFAVGLGKGGKVGMPMPWGLGLIETLEMSVLMVTWNDDY